MKEYNLSPNVDRDYIEVNLDLHDKTSTSDVQNYYVLKQGDHISRVLRCNLTKGGLVPIDLKNSVLTLYIKKADMGLVAIKGTIVDATNGIVDFPLTRQSLAIADKIICEVIKVGSDASTMSFPLFSLQVEDTIADDDLIESTDEFSLLNDALAEVAEWESNFSNKYKDISNQFEEKYSGLEQEYAAELSAVKNRVDNTNIINVKDFGAKGDGVTDDTEAFKKAILSAGDSFSFYIPSGSYKLSDLALQKKQKVHFFGNGELVLNNTLTTPLITFSEIEELIIEYLTFKGAGNNDNAYDENKSLVKITSCSFGIIEKCRFKNHSNHCIVLEKSLGTYREKGFTIDKCEFSDISSVNSNNECSILIKASCEYGKLTQCYFNNVASAIHCFGANWFIDNNNVTNGTLNVSATNHTDFINSKQGWIVCAPESNSVNATKTTVTNNRINHTLGNAPSILVIGNRNRNECYYEVSNNHSLVCECSYYIIVSNADGTNVIGNKVGRHPISNQTKALFAFDTNGQVTFDNNHCLGDVVTAYINNSNVYDGQNSYRGISENKENYQYGATCRRIPLNKKSFAMGVLSDGSVASSASDECNFTVEKTSTGVYKVTHNIGHLSYFAFATPDTANIVNTVTRTTNDITVNVRNYNGELVDGVFWFMIKLHNNGYYNLSKIR